MLNLQIGARKISTYNLLPMIENIFLTEIDMLNRSWTKRVLDQAFSRPTLPLPTSGSG